MRRQLDTAAPFGDPEVDPRWDEYDTADVLGAHSTSSLRPDRASGGALAHDAAAFQVVLEAGMDAWIAAATTTDASESWPTFRSRVADALAELGAGLGKGGAGLVFTSSGVIATAAIIALGITDTAMPSLNRLSMNASITKLLHGRRGSFLVSYNEHGNLEGPRDLMTFR